MSLLDFAEQSLNAALDRGVHSIARRDPIALRRYERDPKGYARDILGLEFGPQFDAVWEGFLYGRLLLVGGNNLGKTTILAAGALWVYDCLGALPEGDQAEGGARVMLGGPDHPTIKNTGYHEMFKLAERAEARGRRIAGFDKASDRSVNWQNRAHWDVEGFSPPQQAKGKKGQAHNAAGRHSRYMFVWCMEGNGTPSPVWKSLEGVATSDGNIVVGDTNPTDDEGPLRERCKPEHGYMVVHLSCLEHVNVIHRRPIIPSAISVRALEKDIHRLCIDLGPADQVESDPAHHDFVWALPPRDYPEPEPRPREDGRGHADFPLHVFRPKRDFVTNRLGQWPADGAIERPFSQAALDQAVALWHAMSQPDGPPDALGLDSSWQIRDEVVASPYWGPTAAELLAGANDAETLIARGVEPDAAYRAVRARAAYVGMPRVVPALGGEREEVPEQIAAWLAAEYPHPQTRRNIEYAGGGEVVASLSTKTYRHKQTHRISPAGKPGRRGPLDEHYANKRAELYLQFAQLVNRGLVALPPHPLLLEELAAIRLTTETKTKRVGRRTVVVRQIEAKDDMKLRIGRSPDYADAGVLGAASPSKGRVKLK